MWSTGDWQCAATLKFDEAATSVAATVASDARCVSFLFKLRTCSKLIEDTHRSCHVLSVGLENGQIHTFTASLDDIATWNPLNILDVE